MRQVWRLKVDWIKCDGYGLCGDLAPDLVALDDWRYPMLIDRPISGPLLDDARRAVDCCPALALTLEQVPAEERGRR